MAVVYDYFAAECRERKIRTPELALWIVALDIAKGNAEHLASGRTLDTPSKDLRRRRWDFQYDISDTYEWLAASDEGGFLWIGSVIESFLGGDAFDFARFEADVRKDLATATAELERMEREVVERAVARPPSEENEWRMRALKRAVMRVSRLFHPGRQLMLPLRGLDPRWDEMTRAAFSTKTLPRRHVPRQDAREARVLRGAPGKGNGAVGSVGQGTRRTPVAAKGKCGTEARRVSV